MVEEHIHKLLFEHDCVIIPDFGGLITHYASARIHPVKHTFMPPSKRIAFNEKLKLNDGLLISTLAYDRKIPTEEAQAQVTRYVHQLQEGLRDNRQYEMKGVGVFRYNQEQKIQFEYISAENLNNYSFGLPELISRPVPAPDVTESLRTFIKEKNTQAPAAAPQKTWRRRLRRVYDSVAVMAIAGLSVTALYVISLQNEYSQSSLNPFAVFNLASVSTFKNNSHPDFAAAEFAAIEKENIPASPAITETTTPDSETSQPEVSTETPASANIPASETAPTLPAVNPEATVSAKVTAPAAVPAKTLEVGKLPVPAAATGSNIPTTIKTKTHRYYIIAGGYSTLQNARYSRKVANRHGAQGKVILPFVGSKLYRVSIADFNTKEEALAYLPQLKTKYGKNIWILNY